MVLERIDKPGGPRQHLIALCRLQIGVMQFKSALAAALALVKILIPICHPCPTICISWDLGIFWNFSGIFFQLFLSMYVLLFFF